MEKWSRVTQTMHAKGGPIDAPKRKELRSSNLAPRWAHRRSCSVHSVRTKKRNACKRWFFWCLSHLPGISSFSSSPLSFFPFFKNLSFSLSSLLQREKPPFLIHLLLKKMYKNRLQELCQKKYWAMPKYTSNKVGPDHNPRFTASVSVNGVFFETTHLSKSSKEAQSEAAKIAFEHFTTPEGLSLKEPSASPGIQLPEGIITKPLIPDLLLFFFFFFMLSEIVPWNGATEGIGNLLFQ